jgi:CRISPR-associated protein Cas2
MAQGTKTRYILSYDVTDDGKRTKLANLLLDYGERVQKSVFEADLNATEVKEIMAKAANYLASGDSLRLYPLCRTCVSKVESLGRLILVQTPSHWIV